MHIVPVHVPVPVHVHVLTAGEHEVAVVRVERELAELHGPADHRDVTPESNTSSYCTHMHIFAHFIAHI